MEAAAIDELELTCQCLQEDLKATSSQLEETQQEAKALRLQLEALQHAEPKAAIWSVK